MKTPTNYSLLQFRQNKSQCSLVSGDCQACNAFAYPDWPKPLQKSLNLTDLWLQYGAHTSQSAGMET